jgi:hypothetical protein
MLLPLLLPSLMPRSSSYPCSCVCNGVAIAAVSRSLGRPRCSWFQARLALLLLGKPRLQPWSSHRAKIRALAPGVCSLFRLPTPSGKLPRMKPLQEGRTPTQLLWTIAASNALVSIGFGILFVQSWQHHRVPFSQNLPWLAALVVGLIATLLSEAALKEGVASDQWPEAFSSLRESFWNIRPSLFWVGR